MTLSVVSVDRRVGTERNVTLPLRERQETRGTRKIDLGKNIGGVNFTRFILCAF